MKWLLYLAGWALIGGWIAWQQPLFIFGGIALLLAGMIVAGNNA